MKLSIGHLLAISLTLIACACSPDDPMTAPDRGTLKIALVDSLCMEFDDEARRLPDNIRELCAVLTSNSKECNRTYILDPLLVRLDLNKVFSLKTMIEKGGSKDVNNPKVIGRLIQKNFDKLEIPREFTTRRIINKDAGKLVITFITTESVNDSILVFSDNSSSDSYSLNGRAYKVFTDVSEVKSHMLNILCQNEKTNFTLLINPPVAESGPVISVQESLSKTPVAVVKPVRPPVNYYPLRKSRVSNSDLIMIKGSEGCDVCTRYYSATDNLGHTRQITEKNSTNCCPCGKTVEIRGRTYRMDCDGAGSNRLALVE